MYSFRQKKNSHGLLSVSFCCVMNYPKTSVTCNSKH